MPDSSALGPAEGSWLLVQLLIACGASAALGITVVGAWISRELTHTEGVIYLGAVLLASVLLIQSMNSALFFPLLLGMGVALWLLRAAAGNRARRRRDSLLEGDLPRYRAAIQRDPRNAAAHSQLARTLEKLGRPQEAIPHYQRSIELQPHMNEDKYRLDALLRSLAEEQAGVRRCPRCLTPLPPRAVDCPQCRRPVGAWSGLREVFGTPRQTAIACALLGVGLALPVVVIAFRTSTGGGMVVVGALWAAIFIVIVCALLRRHR